MQTDVLKDHPRLPTDAMTPCGACGRQLLETGLPLFLRLRIKSCGIDAKAVRERAGLAMMMGGAQALPIADVMASTDPVVVLHDLGDVNICHNCASDFATPLQVLVGMVQTRRAEAEEKAS